MVKSRYQSTPGQVAITNEKLVVDRNPTLLRDPSIITSQFFNKIPILVKNIIPKDQGLSFPYT